MDELIGKTVKFLSSSIIVRIMSYPSFAIEIFLATVICIVHILLIYEVNTQVRRTNAKAAAHLRIRHPMKETETCSYHSLVTLQTTQVFQKKPDVFQRAHVYTPLNLPKLQKKFSRQNFGWMLSKGDSLLRPNFNERVEHLLSISPSEYVRRDKERKSREQGLRSCIQSLTSLLEKALTNETLTVEHMSKEAIKKSINALRENFESQITNNYELGQFPSPSLQSLIGQSTAKNALKNSLSPNLISSIYRASNVTFSRSNFDTSKKRNEDEEKSNNSNENISLKASESLSELFRKQSDEFFGNERRQSKRVLSN